MRLRTRHSQHGFTLIEIMIVVVIIAILTSIALPSYNEHVRKARRADARAGLLQAQQWLERASTATGVYPTTLPTTLTWSGDSSKHYTIGFAAGNTNAAYTLEATPSLADPKCGKLTLTNAGVRGSNGSDSVTDCWK